MSSPSSPSSYVPSTFSSSSSHLYASSSGGGYVRVGEDDVIAPPPVPTKPFPKIGDVVRFDELDGGREDGEILVGKISLISPIGKPPDDYDLDDEEYDGRGRWLLELQELEDVGDGYYADYPSRVRRSKRSLRNLEDVSGPLSASYVRTEGAYKIPVDRNTGLPLPKYDNYDFRGFDGPEPIEVDEKILMTDFERYGELKSTLLIQTALGGLFGTATVGLAKGPDDALTYLVGALAGVGYVYLLSLKTDTIGGKETKNGKPVSNLRFALPALAVAGVAITNLISGGVPDGGGLGTFSTVTSEQFGCVTLGFLTYRVPLLIGQLFPLLGDSLGTMLPGSAGVAAGMALDAKRAIDTAKAKAEEGGGDGRQYIGCGVGYPTKQRGGG